MAGGSGEQALLTATSVQMARFYGLPNSTIAGATDSKLADLQAGYERCLAVTLAAQSGTGRHRQDAISSPRPAVCRPVSWRSRLQPA